MKHSYKKVEKLVTATVRANRVPFLWGPPGVGKSSLARKIASELGMDVKILDAALFEPTDFMIPKVDEKTNVVKYYTQDFLLQENTLILIDDLPHAKPYQMIPLFQLILDRRIGNIKLPDSIRFIVTGNREEDFAEVNPIPTPLLNRFVHFELEPSVDEWLEWAISNNVDNRIVAFLTAYPAEFVHMPKEGVRAWPTPRSWHMLSDLLKTDENSDSVYEFSIATIGESTGSLFTTFVRLFMSLNPENILNSPDVKFNSKQEMYAAILSVAQFLSRKDRKFITTEKVGIIRFYNSLTGEYKLLFGRAFKLFATKNPVVVVELVNILPDLKEKVKEMLLD